MSHHGPYHGGCYIMVGTRHPQACYLWIKNEQAFRCSVQSSMSTGQEQLYLSTRRETQNHILGTVGLSNYQNYHILHKRTDAQSFYYPITPWPLIKYEPIADLVSFSTCTPPCRGYYVTQTRKKQFFA